MHATPRPAAASAPAPAAPNSFVGQRLERLEDTALLSGRGSYADDVGVKRGTLQAAVLRSPHAHARLLSVDAAPALALPGVRAVLTGDDVQRWSLPFVVGVKQPMQHWALAVDRVRHVGEPVAVVVAEDRYIAEDALDLIRVEYEALPALVDIDAALQPDSPLLHEAVGSNIVSERASGTASRRRHSPARAACRPPSATRATAARPSNAASSSPSTSAATRATTCCPTSWARFPCTR